VRLDTIVGRLSDSTITREQFSSITGQTCAALMEMHCGFSAAVLRGAEENGHRSPALAIDESEPLSAQAAECMEHLCFPLARQQGGNCDCRPAAIAGTTGRKAVALSRTKASSRRTFSF
jgi:hypothetical protein